jgi:hypothetical protein
LSYASAPTADALARAVKAYQRSGETTVGWCPDQPLANQPDAASAASGVSGATFPVRF